MEGRVDEAESTLKDALQLFYEKFAAKGAIILKPNYRGSAGYGEKFRSLNVRNLGLGDYDDVISGVDALIAKGMVDADRVGSMGWSRNVVFMRRGYENRRTTSGGNRTRALLRADGGLAGDQARLAHCADA